MKLVPYEALRPEKGITHSPVQVWRLEKKGRFPKRIKIGRRNYWVDEELDQYIAELIAARDAKAALMQRDL
jgi:prophage regulatory protein